MGDILNTDCRGHILSASTRKEISDISKIGVVRARAKGKTIGRPRVEIDWAKIESYKEKGLSERAAVRVCGYSLTTFYRSKKARAVGLQPTVNRDQRAELDSTYIIHAPSVKKVKIGCTKDVRGRYYNIQASSPVPIVLVCSFESLGYEFERYLHVKYAAYNTHGEWFEDTILPMILEDPELQKIMEEYCNFDVFRGFPPQNNSDDVTCNAPPLSEGLDSGLPATQDPDPQDGGRITFSDQIIAPIDTEGLQELNVIDLSDLGSDAMSTMREVRRLQEAGVKITSENKRDELILNAKPEHGVIVDLAVAFGENLQWMKFKDDVFVKTIRDKYRGTGRKIGRPRVEVDFGLVEHLTKRGISERAAAKVCGYPLTTFYRRKKERLEKGRQEKEGPE